MLGTLQGIFNSNYGLFDTRYWGRLKVGSRSEDCKFWCYLVLKSFFSVGESSRLRSRWVGFKNLKKKG